LDTPTGQKLSQCEDRYAASMANTPVDRALAAFDLGQWLIESLMLRRGGDVAIDMWTQALRSLRLTEGMPAQEVVQLVDAAALLLVELRALTEGATGVQRSLDDLVALHERFRERLAVFNRHSVIPVDGPAGPVDPEELLRGRASALQSLLAGRPSEALRVIERALRSWGEQARPSLYYFKARALTARCLHEVGDLKASRRLLDELRDEPRLADSHTLRCEIGDLYAQTLIAMREEQRAMTVLDEFLECASREGLALRWTDLMCTRAQLLFASGAAGEAGAYLRVALLGPRDEGSIRQWSEAGSFPLPSEQGYRLAFMRAQRMLSDHADALATRVNDVVRTTIPPPIPKRSKYRGRQMPPRLEGEARRAQLHDQALAALREFEERGKPFVLYLRKFDVTVLHRAALLGPGLLECGLYDILPESYNMLTIQDSHEAAGYTGTGTAFDRTVPSLNLDDDKWETTARYLIAHARAIISECLMLSEGVRTELEIIDQFHRNDDTLLVLPSAGGSLPGIDNDPLVRRFQKVVRAEALSEVDLWEIPFVARLLEG
jgi:hypothetical protein